MRILIFSSLPPTIGGVTKSAQNLLQALKAKSIDTSVVVNLSSIKLLFRRYDIAHIHYSKRWKRLLGLVLGKIVAKKVIFTLHSNSYKNGMLNYLSSKLANGVILLNKNAEKKYKHKFKNSIVLGSIFAEGITQANINNKKYIQRKDGKIYLLVYAFNKVYRDSKDVYGVDFILENFSSLDNRYCLVLLDIKGAYRNEINSINSDSLIHLDYEVDFLSLLSEVDIYLRPTTTDGSSVAVQEALLLGKNVLASDVVERPAEVTIYEGGSLVDFKEKLENIKNTSSDFYPNSIDDYITFCKKILER